MSVKPQPLHSKLFNDLLSKIGSFSLFPKSGLKFNRSVSKLFCLFSRFVKLIDEIALWLRSIIVQLLFVSNSVILKLLKLLEVLSNSTDDDALKQKQKPVSESSNERETFLMIRLAFRKKTKSPFNYSQLQHKCYG